MSHNYYTVAIDYLKSSSIEERNPKFRDALTKIESKYLGTEEVNLLKNIYFKLKDIALRNIILLKLCDYRESELNQFFLDAYKKERYLDMKLVAVRGYANTASQNEVKKMMEHFIGILKKRPQSTPYNYQEYEFIRSACGLPYLIKKYGYTCFVDAFEQEEKQYNAMPGAFKGHYTFSEDGNCILLRKPEEVKKMMDNFFKSRHS